MLAGANVRRTSAASHVSMWLGALALLVAACGTEAASNTTEPLLPIAQSSSVAPAATESGAAATPSGLSATQQDTLDRMVAAYHGSDAEGVLSLWGDEGEHYRPDIEFDLEIGGRWSDVTCDLDSAGRPRCDLRYTNDLLTALDAPPLDGYVRVEMDESGAISSWVYDQGNRATTSAYLMPFSDWVWATDPSAAEDMFDWNGFAFRTPSAQSLWAVKVAEYLEQLN